MKNVLKGLLVICVYFFISLFQVDIINVLGIDLNNLSFNQKIFVILSLNIVLVLIIIFILFGQIKIAFKDLTKNYKIYFKKYFKYWFLLLGLSGVANILISLVTKDIAANENIIREQFKLAPFYVYVSAVFLAPLVEELVFRLGIRNIFYKSNILFILASGLIFGALHVIPTYSNPVDLLYLIPYSIPGFIFAYLLVKTENIFVPMGIHFIHNGVLMTLQLLLLFS